MATDLGPFNMLLLHRVNDGSTGSDVTIGTEKYRVIGRVTTHKRSIASRRSLDWIRWWTTCPFWRSVISLPTELWSVLILCSLRSKHAAHS